MIIFDNEYNYQKGILKITALKMSTTKMLKTPNKRSSKHKRRLNKFSNKKLRLKKLSHNRKKEYQKLKHRLKTLTALSKLLKISRRNTADF